MRNYYYSYLEEMAEELGLDIRKCYKGYNVFFDIKDKHVEVLTDCFRYKIKLKPGTRLSEIEKLTDDVRRSLKLSLLQVVKEDIAIFIIAAKEVERDNRLRRIMKSTEYREATKQMRIALPIGFDSATGRPEIVDLVELRHAIYAGTTGSGKSVGLQILLLSLILQYPPSAVRLLVCDKASDLEQFNDLPNLSYPVIQDSEILLKVMLVLKDEMERRVPLKRSEETSRLPHIVIVIDEFLAFFSEMPDEKMKKLATITLTEILRRGRHAKIHVVLAAHNPTQQKMLIDLADIPTRVAFRCARVSNSVTILGMGGAQKLKGKGDMLFQSPNHDALLHLQGPYISPEELDAVLSVVRQLNKKRSFQKNAEADDHYISYDYDISENDLPDLESNDNCNYRRRPVTTKQDSDDKLLAEIVIWALARKFISCNSIMDEFSMGWSRAKGFFLKLNSWGIVAPIYEKTQKTVLPESLDDLLYETLDFLYRQGYTSADIAEALNSKGDKEL